jgi:hypothetical protein
MLPRTLARFMERRQNLLLVKSGGASAAVAEVLGAEVATLPGAGIDVVGKMAHGSFHAQVHRFLQKLKKKWHAIEDSTIP